MDNIDQSAEWYTTLDCDSDGVPNGKELEDGTDLLDACSYNAASQTINPNNARTQDESDCYNITSNYDLSGDMSELVPSTVDLHDAELNRLLLWAKKDYGHLGTYTIWGQFYNRSAVAISEKFKIPGTESTPIANYWYAEMMTPRSDLYRDTANFHHDPEGQSERGLGFDASLTSDGNVVIAFVNGVGAGCPDDTPTYIDSDIVATTFSVDIAGGSVTQIKTPVTLSRVSYSTRWLTGTTTDLNRYFNDYNPKIATNPKMPDTIVVTWGTIRLIEDHANLGTGAYNYNSGDMMLNIYNNDLTHKVTDTPVNLNPTPVDNNNGNMVYEGDPEIIVTASGTVKLAIGIWKEYSADNVLYHLTLDPTGNTPLAFNDTDFTNINTITFSNNKIKDIEQMGEGGPLVLCMQELHTSRHRNQWYIECKLFPQKAHLTMRFQTFPTLQPRHLSVQYPIA